MSAVGGFFVGIVCGACFGLIAFVIAYENYIFKK